MAGELFPARPGLARTSEFLPMRPWFLLIAAALAAGCSNEVKDLVIDTDQLIPGDADTDADADADVDADTDADTDITGGSGTNTGTGGPGTGGPGTGGPGTGGPGTGGPGTGTGYTGGSG